MISFLSYSKKKEEQKLFKSETIDICSRLTEEDLSFETVGMYSDLCGLLERISKYDVSIIDLLNDRGISVAESIRKKDKEMQLILIADTSLSPVEYVKPTIMASYLLLRPITKEFFAKTIENVLRDCLKKLMIIDFDKTLLIENRGERNLIPYSEIEYLESRDKKIYVIAGKREYSFYDTLDKLEQKLGENFIRCHRSFIVSKLYIKTISFPKNEIYLDDDSIIPISRTYKSMLREQK